MGRGSRVLVAAVAFAFVAARAAYAGQPTGMPHSVFGNSENQNSRQKLDASLSVIEARDSDTPAEHLGVGPADLLWTGYSTMFNAIADYRWQGPRVQFGISGNTGLRHSRQLGKLELTGAGGVGIGARLSRRSSVLLNHTAAYSRSPLYGLFPGDPIRNPGDAVGAAPDYVINDSASYIRSTTASVTNAFTGRSVLTAAVDVEDVDFLQDAAPQPRLSARGIRGEFSRSLAKNFAIDVGYRYRVGDFTHSAATEGQKNLSVGEHGLDLGFEYARPLSPTRRFLLGGHVGSSAMDTPGVANVPDAGRLYRLSSDVSVGYSFKTWQVHGTAQRGLEFVASLDEPVFNNGFTVELNALLNPRLDLQAGARYSTGASALSRNSGTFDTYGGTVRMRYAVAQSLAAFGEYLYYVYDFRRDPQLAPGIPPQLERNGIRVGLSLWVPVLRR